MIVPINYIGEGKGREGRGGEGGGRGSWDIGKYDRGRRSFLDRLYNEDYCHCFRRRYSFARKEYLLPTPLKRANRMK